MPHALIVDDEKDIRDLLAITLRRMAIDAECVSDIATAKKNIDRMRFDFCLTDMNLPDGDGIELVRYMLTKRPDTPIAVITAHGNMSAAITALKAGAFDFISKPVDLNQLRDTIRSVLKLKLSPQESQNSLLGESEIMHKLKEQIHKVARSQAPVFIHGESGTGKEKVAQLIHQLSPRFNGPFVPINCGAIPLELMESEFFGHIKGSFTGAHQDKKGLFQSAEGGTLFLDEVAELSQSIQVKLLRAIQEKKIRPVGSNQEISIDCRIISATLKNLDQEVVEGRFRQDLFYRIDVIRVEVPPLRDRGNSDIRLLCDFFLKRLASQSSAPLKTLSPEALYILYQYNFRGNVRELENILERAFTLCDSTVILQQHLQLRENFIRDVAIKEQVAFQTIDSTIAVNGMQSFDEASDIATQDEVTYTLAALNNQPLEEYLANIERGAILKALEKTRWNRTAAAKILGMTLRSLRYRLQKLGIEGGDD
ncbi:MAG: sigma-54 dependent transcriptional regulator [Pseudomonadota bacterium]